MIDETNEQFGLVTDENNEAAAELFNEMWKLCRGKNVGLAILAAQTVIVAGYNSVLQECDPKAVALVALEMSMFATALCEAHADNAGILTPVLLAARQIELVHAPADADDDDDTPEVIEPDWAKTVGPGRKH